MEFHDRCMQIEIEKRFELELKEKHGHWIERSKVYPDIPYDSTYNYQCSTCGYMDTHMANVEVPYCWHCGAKMDEGEKDAGKVQNP